MQRQRRERFEPADAPPSALHTQMRRLNTIATDFMSHYLYEAGGSCAGELVYAAFERIARGVRNGHVLFKGGLALNRLLHKAYDIVRGDPAATPDLDELLRITERYAHISDFDSAVMLARAEDLPEATRVVAAAMDELKQTLWARIGDDVGTAATAYFRRRLHEVLDVLREMKRGIARNEPFEVSVTPVQKGDITVRRAGRQLHIVTEAVAPADPCVFKSYNDSIAFYSGTHQTAFVLMRVKCAFELTVTNARTRGTIAAVPVDAEVLDVSIPLRNDTGRLAFFAHGHWRHVQTFDMRLPYPSCRRRGEINVPCADLQYIMDDLRFAMYDVSDRKSPKRQLRYWLLRKLRSLVFEEEDLPDEHPPGTYANAVVDSFGALNARSYTGLFAHDEQFARDYAMVSRLHPLATAPAEKTRRALRALFHPSQAPPSGGAAARKRKRPKKSGTKTRRARFTSDKRR